MTLELNRLTYRCPSLSWLRAMPIIVEALQATHGKITVSGIPISIGYTYFKNVDIG